MMSRDLSGVLDKLIGAALSKRELSFRELVLLAGLDPGHDFVGASLRELDFRDEDLTGFNFSRADLSGADFRRAKVAGVSFLNSELTGAIGLSKEVKTQWYK